MKRRGFLKGLFGAALVPIVGKAATRPKPYVHSCDPGDLQAGFGLAPLKREGSVVGFDPMPSKRWVTRQALEDGPWPRFNPVALAEREDMILVEYDAQA